MIVTTNLKHFPDDALKPYQIKALHPDDFLLDQLDLYEEATKAVILGMVTPTSTRRSRRTAC
ncbi:Conserved protein of uncharacterised function (part2) [Mycobacterium tuberculosis]|nr:Conserved protein of uncharacterised function (part2) [Mycobacterium tuberculosis]